MHLPPSVAARSASLAALIVAACSSAFGKVCTGDRKLAYSCTRVGRDRDHDRPRPLS